MPEIERIAEIHDGVTAFFTDGAYISLTLHGVSRCSRCYRPTCEHLRAAVPAFNRRKWDLLEANRESWRPNNYWNIFIDPRIFFRPGEVGIPPVDWAGKDLLITELRQPHGWLGTFADGGHIFVSDGHPDGATKCLKCGTRDCEHYQRVAEEIATLKAAA